MIQKIFNFIKKYKYIILLIILYFIFYLHMQNIYLYADDYNVINILKVSKNLQTVIYWDYFMSWSGRLIGHSIVTAGLGYFGIQFFRFLNPIFLFLFCFYIAKILNIKGKYNVFKLTFFISLIILGLNIQLLREFLYWTDGTILYFWAYVPMLVIVYFVFDYFINNKDYSNLRFFISLFFITIINFTMESTGVLVIVMLFLICIDNFINKKMDKKILFLLIFSSIMLLGCYFIPGNLNRLYAQNEVFVKANLLQKFIIKIPIYFDSLFSQSIFSILLIISGILVYFLIKRKDKLCKICSLFLTIINCLLFVNVFIYQFIDFLNCNSIVFSVLFLYLIMNVLACWIISKDVHRFYFYIVISGICANLTSIILIDYNTMRFYLPLVFSFIIYIINFYLNADDKIKKFILWLFCFVFNWQLGLILLLIIFIFYKFFRKKLYLLSYLLTILFILINMFNFSVTMYYYYQNSRIFDNNIDVLKHVDRSKNNIIYLKRLPYPEYGYHLPDSYSYMEDWYSDYYEIQNQTIIWIDP